MEGALCQSVHQSSSKILDKRSDDLSYSGPFIFYTFPDKKHKVLSPNGGLSLFGNADKRIIRQEYTKWKSFIRGYLLLADGSHFFVHPI